MESIIQAVKDLFGALIALGWQPWPSFIAILMMVSARAWFEPDVLQVNTEKDRAMMGRIKLAIFFGVFIGSGLLQVGFAKPATAFDWCASIGFCIGHTMVAYVVSSSSKFRAFIKDKLGIGAQ